MGTFMAGLKPDIAIELKMWRPKNLHEAIELAMWKDEQLRLVRLFEPTSGRGELIQQKLPIEAMNNRKSTELKWT